jgi:hypothetical protein
MARTELTAPPGTKLDIGFGDIRPPTWWAALRSRKSMPRVRATRHVGDSPGHS